MTQTAIDFERRPAANLERVHGDIGPAIAQFFQGRVGHEFHGEDLLRYVRALVGHIAPESPARVMRIMRSRGEINYSLVSRRDSLYRVEGV